MNATTTRTRRPFAVPLLLALLLAVGPFLLSSRPARAARTFVVTTVGDQPDRDLADDRCDISAVTGVQCTLRAAIQEANDTVGPDTIAFDIRGGGVQRIHPGSELPAISERATIDGYTQPGASPNTAAVGTNAELRIVLEGQNRVVRIAGLRINAPNSVVRGLAIRGFFAGVVIGRSAPNVRILGCFIGVDADGADPQRSNRTGGVVFGTNATIGGATPAARNIISGNFADGIELRPPATAARVLGNLIGTGKTDAGNLGNGAAGLRSYATNVTIGGDSAAAANVIQFNGGDGVTVLGTATSNRILRNAIFGNAGQGIDLNNDGRTLNDLDDPDLGPNRRQNFPVIAAVTSNEVQVALNSIPDQDYVIRLYSNFASGDQGRYFHGAFAVATDATGNVGPVTLNPTPPVPAGRSVTVTATRQNGDTSEFSNEVAVS